MSGWLTAITPPADRLGEAQSFFVVYARDS